MAVRWYIMPSASVDMGARGARVRPRFIDTDAPGVAWAWMPVRDGWGIGWADLTTAQNSTYAARAGVRFLTANLDAGLGAGAVTALQAALDARELPSAWVSAALTWRQAIKRVLSFIQCIQRFYGETRQSLNVGRPRTTRIDSLSVAVRDQMISVCDTLMVPRFDEASDDIEAVVQRWADVLVMRPVFIGGVAL